MRPAAAVALGITFTCLPACEAPPDLRSEDQPITGDPAPVIIHFARGVDLPALAAAGRPGRPALLRALRADAARAQAGALALLRRRGLTPGATLWSINALIASVPAGLLVELEALPDVARVGAAPPPTCRTSPASLSAPSKPRWLAYACARR